MDPAGEIRVLRQVALGLGQDQEAGAAGCDQLRRALLGSLARGVLGQGQVPRRQGEGLDFINGHVRRGAAAVPVVELPEGNVQLPKDGEHRLLVRLGVALH